MIVLFLSNFLSMFLVNVDNSIIYSEKEVANEVYYIGKEVCNQVRMENINRVEYKVILPSQCSFTSDGKLSGEAIANNKREIIIILKNISKTKEEIYLLWGIRNLPMGIRVKILLYDVVKNNIIAKELNSDEIGNYKKPLNGITDLYPLKYKDIYTFSLKLSLEEHKKINDNRFRKYIVFESNISNFVTEEIKNNDDIYNKIWNGKLIIKIK